MKYRTGTNNQGLTVVDALGESGSAASARGERSVELKADKSPPEPPAAIH
jgi:hypothetical protein